MSRPTNPKIVCLVCAVVATLSGGVVGCVGDTILESFDTELEIPDPGEALFTGTIEINKRFRFSSDPLDAKRVTMNAAELTLMTPDGSDFGFIDSLEVYVVLDDQQVLIATLPEFSPGSTVVELDIQFYEDLRNFVTNERISLLFRVQASRWYRDWPAEGFRILAQVSLDLELF